MVKYGILSTASIAERFIQGIRESTDGYVEAIASRTLEAAKEYAERHHIGKYYGSYEELYEDKNIDVIYIPTLNSLHYKNAMEAMKHGKHVVVEKPFMMDLEKAKEVFSFALEHDLFVMEAQKSVFLPTTHKLKELIEEGVIGKVKYIELKAGFPGRFGYDHWMYNLNEGGGALYGSATYTIEFMKYLFDDPLMKVNGVSIDAPTGSDDICSFTIKMNDILVSSTIAMNVPLKNEAVFYGDKGYIVVPNYWKSNHLDLYLDGKFAKKYEYPYTSEFVYEIDHINNCINNHHLSDVMYEERTLHTMELVEELQKQFKEARK